MWLGPLAGLNQVAAVNIKAGGGKITVRAACLVVFIKGGAGSTAGYLILQVIIARARAALAAYIGSINATKASKKCPT